jgi:hypothetical protein
VAGRVVAGRAEERGRKKIRLRSDLKKSGRLVSR